jgi:EmrB/QacA subfamily drug resistance transporter
MGRSMSSNTLRSTPTLPLSAAATTALLRTSEVTTGGRGAFRRPGRSTVMLAVILTTQLMVVLDGTIVNVALPDMQRALAFSPTQLSWVINAYALTFGGLLMFGARCGDLLGRRRTFLTGIGLFSLGSLAGGFATVGWFLLAARALQGIGGALAAPATLALLMSMFPEGRARVRAIGMFAAVSVGGAASGLLAGGLLVQLASWRWVFFVNVPIGLGVLAIGRLVLDETERERGRFDATGALTSTLGVGALVYGLVEAASVGWSSATTLGAFAVGVVLLTVFVLAEQRAAQPILPLRLLADPTRTGANVARGLLYAGGYGMFFFLTQFLQDVRGYSPLETGLAFLPIPISVFAVSQLTTRWLVVRFPVKRLMIVGLVLSTIGMAVDSQLSTASGYLVILPSLLLFGAGNGISFVTLTGAALTGVRPGDAGAASGLINVMQQLGAALGVAVLVTVFGSATSHAGLASPQVFTRGVDDVFTGATLFLVLAIGLVAAVVRPRESEPATIRVVRPRITAHD